MDHFLEGFVIGPREYEAFLGWRVSRNDPILGYRVPGSWNMTTFGPLLEQGVRGELDDFGSEGVQK